MTITCRHCGRTHEAATYGIINAAQNPELKAALKDGRLALDECPHCGRKSPMRYEMIYHDPAEKFMLMLCSDERSALKANMIVSSTEGLEDYRLRLVNSFGEMIEKVNIFDSGLDDIVVEFCKYAAKLDMQETMKGDPRLEDAMTADFKFLRTDGADNAMTLAYPSKGRMEMVEVPFSLYENCRSIVERNPALRDNAKGFARVDADWLSSFIK